MKLIEYEGKGTFELPEGWHEVTINQFQLINELQEEKELDRIVSFISILSGLKVDDVLDLPIGEFNKLKEQIQFINEQQSELIKYTFEINGKLYGYRNDFTKMKTSEYIDFDTLITSENLIGNLHNILAVLYRPVIKHGNLKKQPTDYLIEEYNSDTLFERGKLFQDHLTVDILISAMLFQTALAQALSEVSLDYLTNPKKVTRAKKRNRIFKVNGGGLFRYIKSVVMTWRTAKGG